MTIISAYPSTTVLSTAWMPLDGLIQQWGAFGAEQASTATALHAVGMAFCALARETTARAYYTAAWHAAEKGDLTDLEHALEEQRARVALLVHQTQQTLWGDEVPQPTTRTNRTQSRTTSTTCNHTAADCPIYGHDWQTVGMSGEKKCLACGTLGYCPGCAPDPPPHAHPFSCSRHTPLTESQVRP